MKFVSMSNNNHLTQDLIPIMVTFVTLMLLLQFLGCASDRQASQRVNSFPMKDMHSRGSMMHPDERRDAPVRFSKIRVT